MSFLPTPRLHLKVEYRVKDHASCATGIFLDELDMKTREERDGFKKALKTYIVSFKAGRGYDKEQNIQLLYEFFECAVSRVHSHSSSRSAGWTRLLRPSLQVREQVFLMVLGLSSERTRTKRSGIAASAIDWSESLDGRVGSHDESAKVMDRMASECRARILPTSAPSHSRLFK